MPTTANYVALAQERMRVDTEYQGNSEAPLYQHVCGKNAKKEKLNAFGTRITVYLGMPGGHTAFTYADPSFRAPIETIDDAMRVYPASTALAVQFDGNILRNLKAGADNLWIKYQETIDRVRASHKQVISRWLHGDGTGTMARSASAIGTTGPATMNGQVSSGGTSGQGVTKGTAWLQKNFIYDAINPSTGAVRGTFTVTTAGKLSCAINVTAGTIASGDYIVLQGTYNKVPVGLRHLADWNNRVVQNFNTANAPELNSLVYDAGGNAITPAAFSTAKAMVRTALNQEDDKPKLIVMTQGHQATLVNQAFQYRTYNDPKGNQTVYGVFNKYVDADGDIHFIDADAPDEQIRILDGNSYRVGEDMPLGFYDDDGNTFRMIVGTYNSGGDRYIGSIGWSGQLFKDGVAQADVVIDDVGHAGADFVKQAM